jgi:hypothetical protein
VKRVARLMFCFYSIPSYFKHHITNAIAEGINSKIATVQKMAYGYRNRENLKIAIFFHYGNLEMWFRYPLRNIHPQKSGKSQFSFPTLCPEWMDV